MKVSFSAQSRLDLIAIGDFIARDNPPRAESFVQELVDKCASLADMPQSHPRIPRYERSGLRRRTHGAYQILFRVEDDGIQVVRILHGARDLSALLPGSED